MPSAGRHGVGVKLVTRAPRNAHAGPAGDPCGVRAVRPDDLGPALLLDGTALTTLRTPAVSVAAVRPALARFAEPPHVVVFGAGPQGIGHLEALCAVLRPASATFVVRRAVPIARSQHRTASRPSVRTGSAGTADALRRAGIVVCATTAREPLFDSTLLDDAAVVIAVGAHEPDAREVDAAFCARAQVVVEDVDAACARAATSCWRSRTGRCASISCSRMRDVVTGAVDARSRPSGAVQGFGDGVGGPGRGAGGQASVSTMT